MSEFISSLLKGLLSFSFATLVITIQPPAAFAADLSDETIQAELGLEPARLDKEELKVAAKKEDKKAVQEEHKAPTLAAPGFGNLPTKKK